MQAGGWRRRARQLGQGLAVVLVLHVGQAAAGGLGIPLDGFLQTFVTFILGVSFIVALVGLLGYVGSAMNNTFGNMLAGSVNFFVLAGLLGGGVVILGLLGLAAGATLP